MSPYLCLFSSALFGQFLLVLMPGVVRAMIQLPAAGVGGRELIALPVLMLLGGALSYAFFLQARIYRGRLLDRMRADALDLVAASGCAELGPALDRYLRRVFVFRVDAPLIVVRFLVLLALMYSEGAWIGAAGTTAAALFVTLQRLSADSAVRSELREAARVVTLQLFPALVALVFLLAGSMESAKLAALFLFFGLMYEIAYAVEQLDLPRLEPTEQVELSTIWKVMLAWPEIPSGRILCETEALPVSKLPVECAGKALVLARPGDTAGRAFCHFLWKNNRLEVLS